MNLKLASIKSTKIESIKSELKIEYLCKKYNRDNKNI